MLLELGFASPLLVPRDVAVCKQVVDAYSNTVVALDQQAATATRQALGSSQSREAADIALRLWRMPVTTPEWLGQPRPSGRLRRTAHPTSSTNLQAPTKATKLDQGQQDDEAMGSSMAIQSLHVAGSAQPALATLRPRGSPSISSAGQAFAIIPPCTVRHWPRQLKQSNVACNRS